MHRLFLSSCALILAATGCGDPDVEAACCEVPQAPRDLDVHAGDVPAATVPGPPDAATNLCNVHFHEPTEHAGYESCPSIAESDAPAICDSVEVGDEIEFHWVYTNCSLSEPPEKGLDNCACEPDSTDEGELILRVVAQVYVVGDEGLDLSEPSGSFVTYAGSTTGPAYTDGCSEIPVNWQVEPACQELDRTSLEAWCADNPWVGEDHPHGARPPISDPACLAPLD